MSDMYFDDLRDMAEDGARAGGRGRAVEGLTAALGLVVSLGLVGGMVVWGYELLKRDVEGVPVVQAMEGGFRFAPDDPGGSEAPYQGLSVNSVAEGDPESPPPTEVRLAPPPVSVAMDDPAGVTVPPHAPADAAPDLPLGPDAGDGEVDIALPDTSVRDRPEDALDTDLAVIEALRAIADETVPEPEPAAMTRDLPSARPLPRPGGALAAAVAPVADADEIAVSDLPVGTRLAQLGAYATEERARLQWRRTMERFPQEFAGKRRVVQAAGAGGTLWRLRVEGFADIDDSRRFCAALLAGRADCIPVAVQ